MASWAQLLFSLANIVGSSATPVVSQIASLGVGPAVPAARVVTTQSHAGVNLFDYEAIQLTDDVLKAADTAIDETDILSLFEFENSNNSETASKLTRNNDRCRHFPGDWKFPKPDVWPIFDRLLGGALIKTTPVGASCYKSSGVYDATKCQDVLERFTTAGLHTSDPTSIMWPLFQGRTCMPENGLNGTCTLGGYASYSVNLRNVAQIQLSINFARNRNLRLVIKNTGHDYIGKSSGAGAPNLWTHNLKGIQFMGNYTNAGYSGPAFKAGAGVQGFEMLEAARNNDVTVLAGICETGGCAGGYLAGGGHSPLASIYGMAADQVLAFEVVTADGRFVTASESVNPDLLWALRGGGGSTFGVVTSAVVKAHPRIKVTKSMFTFQAPPKDSENFWKAVKFYFKRFPTYTNAGTYSYFWIWNYGTHLDFRMAPFFAPNHTVESFNMLTKPLFDEFRALNISVSPNTTFHEDFYSANKGAWGADALGMTTIRQGTRLFPKSLWETPAKMNSFYEAIRNTVMSGASVGGYHMAPGNPFKVNNAVNPAWRNTQSFLITANRVPENATPAQLKEASDKLTYEIMEPWRKIAPASAGGGVYLNEADIQEPHWKVDFYGAENYPRLLSIKRKWDPQDVFYATTAVGSERWEVRTDEQGLQTQNGRLCRVSQPYL